MQLIGLRGNVTARCTCAGAFELVQRTAPCLAAWLSDGRVSVLRPYCATRLALAFNSMCGRGGLLAFVWFGTK